jgi:Flp pilus assembly protein TadG
MGSRKIIAFRHTIATWQRESNGSALIEAAAVLPILIVLLLGTMDFGRVFYTAMTVTHAARAGAQYGIQTSAKSSDSTGMQNAATVAASDVSGFSAKATRYCKCWSGATETAMASCSSLCGGTVRIYVQVIGSATFSTMVNYPGIPASVRIWRTARMRAQ